MYTISNLGRLQLNICGGVAADNGLLGAILSKAAVASGSQIDSIIARNTLPENNVQTFINRMPLLWILVFFMTVVLILLVVSIIVFKANQQRGKARIAIAQAELAAAEQARAAEAEFLSNMSHDMRTPLNGILGFTELALQDDDAAQRQAYLEKVRTSGRLMLALVNDVLDLSKITSGKMELHPRAVSLEQLLDAVVASVQLMASQKQLNLQAVGQGIEGRFVAADELRLQQIMLNLLSNAIKYTPEGGTVRCELALTVAEPCVLRLCVIDTGIGMSEDFQQHMFEPFSQENRAEAVQGTGLGLCIVKKIVDLMDGTIEVDSQQGRGSAFTVQIQLPAAAAPAAEPEVQFLQKDCLKGRRLLLCEDNEINAELARLLLEQYGAQVDWAENGKAGVQLFQASTVGCYDAILMDLRMPVMDGFAATRLIRSLERSDAAVPILALSADAYAEDVQKCLAAGMNGHVAKPLECKELLAALEKVWWH